MSNVLNTEFDEFLEEGNVVTAHAKPGDRMERLQHSTPGQGASPEELGGSSTTKPEGDEIGKKASSRMRKSSSKVNAGAKSPDGMARLQGSAPGQSGMREEEEIEDFDDEDILSEAESCDDEYNNEKEDKKKSSKKTEMKAEEIEVDITDDLNALFYGEELSEHFMQKAATIFEAAVKAKVVEEVQKFEALYEQRLIEEIEEIAESLETRVDAHLDYVAEQWIAENQLSVDNGIKTEIAENLMQGLANLFLENNIDLPEEQQDVVAEMAARLDEMEEKLNEQIEVNVELNQEIGSYIKHGIIAEVSEGLANTQKEKLFNLSEGVEFISEESFRGKIETIKENYFPRIQSNYVEDLVEKNQDFYEGPMAAYVNAVSRWAQ
jgi:SHS2 domain-containing protein